MSHSPSGSTSLTTASSSTIDIEKQVEKLAANESIAVATSLSLNGDDDLKEIVKVKEEKVEVKVAPVKEKIPLPPQLGTPLTRYLFRE